MWKLKIGEGTGPWLSTTNGHVGRQYWEFDPETGTPEERAQVEELRKEFKMNRFQKKQSSDLLMRMQLRKENYSSNTSPVPEPIRVEETEDITEKALTTTLRRAISFFSTIQAHDGHWPTENAGPLFFIQPLVIALYVTGDLNTILQPEHQKEVIRYLYNHQNEDGGWGIHIEGHSTIFGSALSYITLRLLGEGTEDGEDMAMARGRKWILDHGGAVGIPSWGKFWLTVLGVYEWDGCNPMPPEFWLLPKFLPVHPRSFLCYCRLVYMPMSYLYGKRFVGTITSLVQSLRQELYVQSYDQINWNEARNTCAKEDLYYPHPFAQDMLWGFLHHFAEPILKRWPFSSLRERALQKAMEHVHYEDKCSRYLCIGCVEKVLCLMVCWVQDPNSDAYKRHLARIPDYFWLAEDGLKIQSFGSQTWDAVFAVQAIMASDLSDEYESTLRKGHDFIKASQVKDNPPENYSEMYRHISKGSWTFAIQDHGWQVSDCTAEGLKIVKTSNPALAEKINLKPYPSDVQAALLFSQMPAELVGESIGYELLCHAVNIILSLQGEGGGFSAWEPMRAYRWVEKFNPTEFFEDVLIEREYVECTASAIEALILFKKCYPGHRTEEIEDCIKKGIQYIENTQEHDGSWYGCWGICYAYGTMFAVKGLVASGQTYHNSASLRKACHFLLSKQLADGGWGESYLSCTDKVYTNLNGDRSNIVQTSWALLALIEAGQGKVDPTPIHLGVKRIINSQMDDGDFPQQDITGVFMKTCTLNYSSYRNIFPIWAMGEYRRHILK